MASMKQSIKNWGNEERPREKLLFQGPSSLTTSELLAVLLHTGTAQCNAVELGRELLLSVGGRLSELSRQTLAGMTATPGVGPAKAATVLAAFELGRRAAAELPEDQLTIRNSETVFKMMSPLTGHLRTEECWVIYLNKANRTMGRERVGSGGIDFTAVDVRTVVRKAAEKMASSIILVHNHPSGNPHPGEADIRFTANLRSALSVFGIALTDHVVIAGKKYFSFVDENC